MIPWMLVLPVFLGMAAVLQATLNRSIAKEWGLPLVVAFNGTIFFVTAWAFYFLARKGVGLAEVSPRWWYFLPGIFSFLFIAGMPVAIRELGAFVVFAALILGQIVTSLLWDAQVEGRPVTLIRVACALLMFVTVLVVSKK